MSCYRVEYGDPCFNSAIDLLKYCLQGKVVLNKNIILILVDPGCDGQVFYIIGSFKGRGPRIASYDCYIYVYWIVLLHCILNMNTYCMKMCKAMYITIT